MPAPNLFADPSRPKASSGLSLEMALRFFAHILEEENLPGRFNGLRRTWLGMVESKCMLNAANSRAAARSAVPMSVCYQVKLHPRLSNTFAKFLEMDGLHKLPIICVQEYYSITAASTSTSNSMSLTCRPRWSWCTSATGAIYGLNACVSCITITTYIPWGLAHFRLSMLPVFGQRISCQEMGTMVVPVATTSWGI